MRSSSNALVIKRRLFIFGELLVIFLGPCFLYGAFSAADLDNPDEHQIAIVYIACAGLLNIFSVHLLLRLIREILTRNPRIIIDERGIENCETKKLTPWDDIRYAYTIKVRRRKRTKSTHKLVIITKKGTKEIIITDFAYTKSKIREAVEGFSGRDIGDKSDQVRDEKNNELASILEGNAQGEAIKKIVMPFGQKLERIKTIVFLAILGLSIYLQVLELATFVLLMGFVTAWNVSSFVGSRLEQNFRKQEPINQLDDETYHKVALVGGIRPDPKTTISPKIVFWFISIVLFVVSLFYF